MPVAVLSATKCTYVDEANPGNAFGAVTPVYVAFNGSSQRKITLLQWDVSAIPSDAIVLDVRLRLWQTSVTTPTAERVSGRIITSAWTESTVDYSGLPTFRAANIWGGWGNIGPTPVSNENIILDVAYNRTIESHVESVAQLITDVQAWVAGTLTNNGIMLYPSGDGVAEFQYAGRTAARDFHVPTLEVVYATADTLPASAADDLPDLRQDTRDSLDAGIMEEPTWALTIELDSGDEDLTDRLLPKSAPIIRRLPFLLEDMEFDDNVFVLDNSDGYLSPDNREGPFWYGAAEGKIITYKATVNGEVMELYSGIVEQVEVTGDGDDSDVELLVSSSAMRELSMHLLPKNWWQSTPQLDGLYGNPAELAYDSLHNRIGVEDTRINLSKFVAAHSTFDTNGIKFGREHRGMTGIEELHSIQRAGMFAIYQDKRGRYALHVWEPTEPSGPTEITGWSRYRFFRERRHLGNRVLMPWAQLKWEQLFVSNPSSIFMDRETSWPEDESIETLGIYERRIDHQTYMTADVARKMARLYGQGLAWPIPMLEVWGPVSMLQHDLGDDCTLTDPEKHTDFTGIVVWQEIAPESGDAHLILVAANWTRPYRDYVNDLDWWGGASTPPASYGQIADPVPTTISTTGLGNGQAAITVGWTHGGQVPAAGFFLLWNSGAASGQAVPTATGPGSGLNITPGTLRTATIYIPENHYITLSMVAYAYGPDGKPTMSDIVSDDGVTPGNVDWEDVRHAATVVIIGDHKGDFKDDDGNIMMDGTQKRLRASAGGSLTGFWQMASYIHSVVGGTLLAGKDEVVKGWAYIEVADFEVQFPHGNKSYTGGDVGNSNPGLAFSTQYFVYCSDPGLDAGAVTYVATTDWQEVAAEPDCFYLGVVTTPADGAGDTSGSEGGGGGPQQ